MQRCTFTGMSTTATSSTALSTIIAWLAPIEPQWRASIVERFELMARDNHARFVRWLAGEKTSRQMTPTNRYVRCSLAESRYAYPSKKFAHGTAPELYEADLEAARTDGNREFQIIYDTFVARTVEKLTCMLGERAFTIEGKLALHRLIETAAVVRADGIELTIQLGIKTNYRYGQNAANGNLTVYSQYPFIVNACIVEGKGKLTELGVDEIAKVLNGTEYEKKIRASADEKHARMARIAEIKRLDGIRAAYSAVAEDLGFAERWAKEKQERTGVAEVDTTGNAPSDRALRLCAKAGVVAPTTAKEARTLRGEVAEKIKALRAEKKAEQESRS